ncbi:MAG: nuclear transport factor 2 family protein [Mucilaginibacter sp.]|nr:nuclear transport factor 2 family protein [Mucilaginibacter sp.]
MKRCLPVVIALLWCLNCFAQNKDAETLKKLNADWIASYVTRDTAKMSRIFGDDLVLINPSGKKYHKKDILKGVMNSAQEFLSTHVDSVDVRLFGNIGIVNAKTSATVKAENKTTTSKVCYMDVYEKRKGRWYAVAAHVTLLD